ncbi:MAG TPA: TIGR03013 family XrtA/PEP-CTERM system glycosyltransferase [Terriglobia bacterium]|nr:TIGR03013 family XrtA/PEP-CTERM system glycosyltransferase [Terriglobia bacterium]
MGEGTIICASFLGAALLRLGPDSLLVLNYQYGFQKIFAITVLALLCLHYFDLYDLQRIAPRGETWFRLLVVVGILSFVLAGLEYLFPQFVLGNQTFIVGLFILTAALFAWRSAYSWMIRQPFLRERVYVMGSGERAKWLVETMRTKPELGMEVVGWTGDRGNGTETRESLGAKLVDQAGRHAVSRVIVALGDRRGTMPVRELLDIRLSGIKVEDATGIMEKISGKMDVDSISPSWLIFSEGFELKQTFRYVRRLVSFAVSLVSLVVVLPLLPVIAILIKLTSPGPVLYRQKRVGRNGVPFYCLKFRTMRADAEAASGAQWAGDDDPRITSVGRWLRRIRLDEIPQLWNVLRGDMGFVGPRPERPEFVEWLSQEIPYYNLRHIVRPGVTGWAQIRYQYGASLEDSKEKLRYDLYYIKHLSVSFDVMIIMETLKIILLGRGAR